MSLTTCISKAGAYLRDEDRAQILRRASELRDEGQSAHEAGVSAITEQAAAVKQMLEAAEAELAVARSAERDVTSTPEFKRWFGGSKVVDENGAPLRVYTGTSKDVDFKAFKVPKNGVWFTADPKVASDYAKDNDSQGSPYNPDTRRWEPVNTAARVIPAYLRIERPYTLSEAENERMRLASNYKRVQGEIFDAARARGHDGVDMGDGTWVVIGEPAQIKSATGNRGTFDPNSADITRSAARAPLWYSQLHQAILQAPDRLGAMSAMQWQQWLKANAAKLGVKQDEITWSGIEDYLKLRSKDKLSREELAGWVEQNGVKVEETVLGAKSTSGDVDIVERGEKFYVTGENGRDLAGPFSNWPEADAEMARIIDRDYAPAKYGEYTLPGGTNYREVLLTLPERRPLTKAWRDAQEAYGDDDPRTIEAKKAARAEAGPGQSERGYRSSHWDRPNVLAHIRVNDRTDADGKKVLFVEEIQSDWGQAAKKNGVQRGTQMDGGQLVYDPDERERVPAAPFVTKTDAWVALALKRIIKMAVDEGYDAVAFVNGEQSADRYDLSKKMSRVTYNAPGGRHADKYGTVLKAYNHQGVVVVNKTATPEELPDHLGKEVAQRLLESKPDNMGQLSISGLDLKVGGEGMQAFYDQIVPQVARDVLKKVGGGQVGSVRVGPYVTGNRIPRGFNGAAEYLAEHGVVMGHDRDDEISNVEITSRADLELFWNSHNGARFTAPGAAAQQPGFDITDKMREAVHGGLPLFSVHRNDPALESWAEAALAGQPTRDAYKKVAAKLPHAAWLMAGLDGRLPVTIDRRLVSHLRRSGHEEVTAGMIGRLASLMERPRVMIRNEGVDGNGEKITRYQALVDARDHLGRPLLVAVRKSKEGASDVYDVRSMFGRQESMQYVLDQLRHGNVVWMADKEVAALRDFTGGSTVPRAGAAGAQPSRVATTVIVPGDAAAAAYPTKGWKQNGNTITIPVDARRRAEGAAFSVGRDPQVDTDAFRAWFGGSKVVDEEGRPLVVYHGTTHDFTSFKPRAGNAENDFGRGIYATSSADDAGANYAGEGEDLTNRIERRAEQIAADNDWEYDDPRAAERARKELNGGAASVMPLYMRIENPLVLDADESTWMDERAARKFARSVDKAVRQYEIDTRGAGAAPPRETSIQLDDLVEAALDGGRADRLIAKARNAAQYVEDLKSGAIISSEIVRKAIAAAGYDGVIDRTVSKKWGVDSGRHKPMTGVSRDTAHYIAFRAEQVKSAIGNNGAFDPKSKDVTRSAARWTDERIDQLLSAYAYTQDGDRTKAFAGWVSPNDYLAATTPADERDRLEAEREPLDVAELARQSQEIMLIGEPGDRKTFKIDGHEGRHRMMALRDAGVARVPVVFYVRQGVDAPEPLPSHFATPQRWGHAKAEKGFLTGSLLPISYNGRKALRERFGRNAEMDELRRQAGMEPEVAFSRDRAPAWWSEPSDNLYAKGMTNGEVIEDWLRRHRLEPDNTGRFTFFHGTPAVGGATDSLREGSLLATRPEDAAHHAAHNRYLKPNQVRVARVKVFPWQIEIGHWASLREPMGGLKFLPLQDITRSADRDFPIVAYRGGDAYDPSLPGPHYFMDSPEGAAAYGPVTEYRIRLDRPHRGMDAWDSRSEAMTPRKIASLRKAGYNSVIATDTGTGDKHYIVFDREHVGPEVAKSTGRDEVNSAQEHWASPGASKFDDLVYKLQDKHVDTKRVVEAVKAADGTLRDDLDVYLQEELFHGRAAKRTQDFVHHELQPLIDRMAEDGLQVADLDEYLHARHAREANEVIARRNPEIQDGGSGMLNQDAEAYFAELDPARKAKLDAAAAHVDRMLAKTRELLVDYQLESRAKVQGWAEMFEHYVPLMREDEGGHSGNGTGQGFSIKGKEVKSRTGSTRKVVDILANIAMQRERTIVRGEKNRVSQALFGLAAANPNEAFWTVDTHIPSEQVYNPATGLVETRPDNLYKQRPNVVVTKIMDADGNVSERAVVFNEKDERALRMAEALKNLDAAQLEGLLGMSAKLTRYFASVNTQYNPVFGVVNLVRDVQGALVNLGTTEIADKKAEVARQAMSALRGIYGDLRAVRKGGEATSTWAQLWEEFQRAGGQTGYRDLFRTSEDRAKAIEHALDPTAWMDSKLGKIFTANGALKVPMAAAQRGAKWIFDWLSDYNEAMENGVRLAAYKTARDAGLSQERAASLAKNLTVNFNRKGQAAQQAGALYAFFNASAQGTARLGATLFDMEPGKPKTIRLSGLGKKVVYGGLLLGSLQALALAAAGFGDDDPPEWQRERSLIIPIGDKKFITIPLPLGLHIIPNIGRVTTAWALGGFRRTPQRLAGLLGSLADAFNPIGNAGLSMQTLAPTALDPLVALTENRDWSGRPIARESRNKATPGHALARDTASSWSKLLSEGINYLSGGTKYTAGVLSPTPDQIDYLVSQVTGGVGRELTKAEQSARAAVSGETVPLYKVPLVGRFVGNAKSQTSEGNAFYSNLERLNEIETEIKGLRKDGKAAEANAVRMANPMAYLITQANHAERQVQKLRKQKSDLIRAGAPREQVVAIEERITARMAALNRAVEKLRAN